MGNVVAPSTAACASFDANVESNWDHLPMGTKNLLQKYHDNLHLANTLILSANHNDALNGVRGTDEVMFSSPAEKVRDGLDIVLNFVILSSQLFLHDKEYCWNLWQTQRSACILAADFLLKRDDRSALLIIFYIALIQEFLSRGPEAVMGCWVVKGDLKGAVDIATSDMKIVRLRDELLFTDLAHLYGAVVNTKTRNLMAMFLSEMLARHCIKNQLASFMEGMKRQDGALGILPIHSFGTCGAVPEKLMKIKCIVRSGPAAFLDMEVYNDTELKWVFKYCLAMTFGTTYKLSLKGVTFAKINLKHFPCLCLQNLNGKGSVFYLSKSGNKTLRELAIKDGDAFQILHDDVWKKAIKYKKHNIHIIPLSSLSVLACCTAPIPDEPSK
mmetsp:Transcript_23260/g.39762  ORF Transcript_23260/g.39762 Transcript_23260/m.39762 type:complete len:385 (+) Transcript_23260:106-1260(+)|eukprot:CAMPEP_0183736318 /NCGR_PEP_ID=MMETSP0737-20130205/49023_1 /TAXON_ID=385413 /ORGANISM="Thalassiosira miniscula, Strain CCMP1093" /LENGTH=384 /DNA_ID=CAMNT_0025970281 /DNA_START=283 /DNA_END=1437 /DNA_ORIENTATION=+